MLYKDKIMDIRKEVLHNAMQKTDCVWNAKLNGDTIVEVSGSFQKYGIADMHGIVKRDVYTLIAKYRLMGANEQIIKTIYHVVTTSGQVYMLKIFPNESVQSYEIQQ